MCQPMEAKLTRPQLPTQLVSFSFDLGGVCSIFTLVFPASGFFLSCVRFLIGRFMYLTLLWVVDGPVGFSFHFQKAGCDTVYEMGWPARVH